MHSLVVNWSKAVFATHAFATPPKQDLFSIAFLQRKPPGIGRAPLLRPCPPRPHLDIACRASIRTDLHSLLRRHGLSAEAILECSDLLGERADGLTQDLQIAAKQLQALTYELSQARGEVAQARGEVAQARGEVTQARGEVTLLTKQAGDTKIAFQTAEQRTMDIMREKSMMHARGIIEVAELFERPLAPENLRRHGADRKELWRHILSTKPFFAACFADKNGWTVGEAAAQIDATFRALNTRMHRNCLPDFSAKNGGIDLPLGGGGSGLSPKQAEALFCICKEYFIRYNVVGENLNEVDRYPGISDPDLRSGWRRQVQKRGLIIEAQARKQRSEEPKRTKKRPAPRKIN